MTIPPEAVEAACKAWLAETVKEYGFGSKWPDDFEDDEKEMMRRSMLAALDAAAPFIRKQVVEECASAFEKRAAELGRQECCRCPRQGECCGEPVCIIDNVAGAYAIRALILAETKETT